MSEYLHSIDIIIIVVYFIGVLIHGYIVGKGHKNADDYFLAGRTLPWFLIGFSLYSSNMSGASFIGLMGATYANGIVVFNYEWTATVVLIFFAFFMAPYFLKAKIATIPEFLEHRFDYRSRTAYSVFTILAIIFIDTAGALYAGGFVLGIIFPGLELWQAVAMLGVFAGLYTILGGLAAVVVTDTVQGILLMLGAAAIFFIGIDQIGGFGELQNKLPAADLEMIKPADHDFLPWPGILGVLLLGFYYWTLNQFIVQRSLGAKNLSHARKGALFAGLLKLPNLFIMIIPGLIGLILYPELERADMIFPTLTLELLPIGLRGLVITALVAAIMSSMDSALNAGSSLVTLDFIKKRYKQMSDKWLVRWGRIITTIIMVISIIYAPMIAHFTTLFEYFQSALAYLIPPVVAVYLTGIFWKRMNGAAAFWTIIFGLMIGIPLFIVKEITGRWALAGLPDIHYTYMAVLIFIAAIITITVISYLGVRPSATNISFTFSDMTDTNEEQKRVWYKDYRWQSLGLIFLIAVILWYYW